MNWLLQLLILWIAFDIVVIATIWFCVSTISKQWPSWWKHHVCDDVLYQNIDGPVRKRGIINEKQAHLYSPSKQ